MCGSFGRPRPLAAHGAGLVERGGVCSLRHGPSVHVLGNADESVFSATVRIQEERGHVVIDFGPYEYVRHPGYTGALAFSLASPVALGSWLALIPAVFLALVLAVRTALEDRTLRAELKGYEEYASRVRSRLVPGLW